MENKMINYINEKLPSIGATKHHHLVELCRQNIFKENNPKFPTKLTGSIHQGETIIFPKSILIKIFNNYK